MTAEVGPKMQIRNHVLKTAMTALEMLFSCLTEVVHMLCRWCVVDKITNLKEC